MIKNNTQAFYLEAKKSLGQNFLKDNSVIENIVDNIVFLSDKSQQKLVHEIGPGSGAITKPLLERGLKVTALEKDKRALDGLQQTLGKEYSDKLRLIETDILKFDPSVFIESEKPLCFGNIPYYITSDIMLWFCKHKQFYSHGIFMVQNEVADRLQAKHRTKDYSRISVKMQLNFTVEKLFVVPASAFVPKPKVNSAIIKLTPKDFSFPSLEKEKSFESFCALLFSARRKMLRRVLHSQLQDMDEKQRQVFWEKCALIQVFEDTRPDAISPQAILDLYFNSEQRLDL
ncbi:MAG: 16S rRNA (adenine(1518)-N(6)/adenine(1519)-N(6))-dimethyltransferase RsmA [Bdellovibrionota bacterium]